MNQAIFKYLEISFNYKLFFNTYITIIFNKPYNVL